MPENGRTIPSEAARSVSTFTILSEGVAISRTYHVLSVTVNKEINRIPSATIIIADGNPALQTFDISSQPDFEPGKHIEIKAGYRSEEETIFRGIVIKHAIKVRQRSSLLVIECRDEAIKMTIAPKNKYFNSTKDSDVFDTLISAHGLDKDVVTTSTQHERLVQYNTTDWDFMLCRTDVNGLFCIPNDGRITIAKPNFSGAASLTIEYGATVHDLDAEIDARFQLKSIKAAGWKAADQVVLLEEGEDAQTPDPGNLSFNALAGVIDEDMYCLQHDGTNTEEELRAWASAMVMKHKLAKVRGKVTTDGISSVSPGQMIQLNGVGERFTGKLFITGVRQQIEDGLWQTVFQFGLNPEWFAETYKVEQPLAGAMLPSVQGLHIGVVTKLENDPEGENRIQVKLPIIHEEEEGIWTRVCTLDAGKDRGTFFLPEIGDEVIIGFLNNDPRHAVMLGMMNSSKHPTTLTASDENHEKGYVSRTGMKLIFNDEHKSILIDTPGGNKILINEEDKKIEIEDQNGNKTTMDDSGIKITSSKDVTIEANSGKIALVCGGNSIKIESSGVTVEAAGNLTLKGAQIELSGGQIALKAAMVKADGMLMAQVVNATSIIGTSYTPGAGNIW